jgi:hypothetical protein
MDFSDRLLMVFLRGMQLEAQRRISKAILKHFTRHFGPGRRAALEGVGRRRFGKFCMFQCSLCVAAQVKFRFPHAGSAASRESPRFRPI